MLHTDGLVNLRTVSDLQKNSENEAKIGNIIPSQMEVAPLHCTVDIIQKRGLFKNTKEIEKM